MANNNCPFFVKEVLRGQLFYNCAVINLKYEDKKDPRLNTNIDSPTKLAMDLVCNGCLIVKHIGNCPCKHLSCGVDVTVVGGGGFFSPGLKLKERRHYCACAQKKEEITSWEICNCKCAEFISAY